jgi:hypothetical protein
LPIDNTPRILLGPATPPRSGHIGVVSGPQQPHTPTKYRESIHWCKCVGRSLVGCWSRLRPACRHNGSAAVPVGGIEVRLLGSASRVAGSHAWSGADDHEVSSWSFHGCVGTTLPSKTALDPCLGQRSHPGPAARKGLARRPPSGARERGLGRGRIGGGPARGQTRRMALPPSSRDHPAAGCSHTGQVHRPPGRGGIPRQGPGVGPDSRRRSRALSSRDRSNRWQRDSDPRAATARAVELEIAAQRHDEIAEVQQPVSVRAGAAEAAVGDVDQGGCRPRLGPPRSRAARPRASPRS